MSKIISPNEQKRTVGSVMQMHELQMKMLSEAVLRLSDAINVIFVYLEKNSNLTQNEFMVKIKEIQDDIKKELNDKLNEIKNADTSDQNKNSTP